jgi:UDP-N-acetylglucosamine transferase subunit ALG13
VIFVSVGTTMPFDALIETVDSLCESGVIDQPVLCQIGNGKYTPKHCEFIRFLPSLDEKIAEASLVIGHGGTGTTLDLLVQGKNFISVANPMAADAHQEIFLERLSQNVELLWTKDLNELGYLIEKVAALGYRKNHLPSLANSLSEFIDSL